MADDEPGEQDSGSAEPDPANLDAAEHYPKHADTGENADRVRDGLGVVKVKEPAHRASFKVEEFLRGQYRTLVLAGRQTTAKLAIRQPIGCAFPRRTERHSV